MSPHELALFLALLSNLSFAGASLVFAVYSRRLSAYWMNAFKAILCFLVFLIPVLFFTRLELIVFPVIWPLVLSGFIGLCLGDFFILSSFARIGPARTLTLFGFQPLIIAAVGTMFLDQEFGWHRFMAILAMMFCLFLFSLEAYRKSGKWELGGLVFALGGMLFDTAGIFLTRWTFDRFPEVSPLQGHFVRSSGAVLGFMILSYYKPLKLWSVFIGQDLRSRWAITTASLMATGLALLLYLWAVQIGHLASISAIAITCPLFATLIESMYYRRRPSWYLLWATVSFAIGFFMMLGVK